MRIVAVHPASPFYYRTPGSSGRPTVADYVEYVRRSMRSYISHKYSRGSTQVNVYRLAAPAEVRLQQCRELTPQEALELLRAARAEIQKLMPHIASPVVLAPVAARARLRYWLRQEFPHLAVVSYDELTSAVQPNEIGIFDADLEPDPVAPQSSAAQVPLQS